MDISRIVAATMTALVLTACAEDDRRQEIAPIGSNNDSSTSAGPSDDSDPTETSGTQGAADTPEARCDAFADRCDEEPFLCTRMFDDGLQIDPSCHELANAYLACLDDEKCSEFEYTHFLCQAEFEAAHEDCPQDFGFCRYRFSNIETFPMFPEACESVSLGCLDKENYSLYCDTLDDVTTCVCYVSNLEVGRFEQPNPDDDNFCIGQHADELVKEHCGWPSGVVPYPPEG